MHSCEVVELIDHTYITKIKLMPDVHILRMIPIRRLGGALRNNNQLLSSSN
jgi:hypothetical protein